MDDKENFYMSRRPVPSTLALQASIIAKTEGLPQSIEFVGSAPLPLKSWYRSLRVILPITACFVVTLAMVISPDNWSGSDAELTRALVVSEDLDWQEIMLLEDEWLLADL